MCDSLYTATNPSLGSHGVLPAALPSKQFKRPTLSPATSACPSKSRRGHGYHRPPMPVQALDGEALVWTDGACSGNPGPGGWAAIVIPPGGDGDPTELSGGAPQTTNNRMEYTAALEGLRHLPTGSSVCIVTDSLLLLKSMTIWIGGWKRRGWKTAGGQPVKNQDLVLALEQEIGRHEAVRWHWVKGHANHGLNDRADELAVAASRAAAAAA